METFSGDQWKTIIPIGIACGLVGFGLRMIHEKSVTVNPSVKKDAPKVVDIIDVEDIAEKVSLCRCWRSQKFPYCDGTHNKFNEECKENVGPVVVKKSK